MNTEDIALLCKDLSIQEKERPVYTLDGNLKDNGVRRLELCLVGKVFSTKLVNKNVFKEVMNKIWRVDVGVGIEQIKGNTFEFLFKSLKARQRVLNGGPWSFDRAIIFFEKPTGEGVVDAMLFNWVDFWVRIHNIPLICMTDEIGNFLGNIIGEVKELDLQTNSDGSGQFLRVGVKVQAKEPLQQSIRVDLLGSGKVTTMLLQYERLLDFCFQCSRLGHVIGECTDTVAKGQMLSDAKRSLVVWIQAENWRGRMIQNKDPASGDRKRAEEALVGVRDTMEELECMESNKHINHVIVGSVSGELEINGLQSPSGPMDSGKQGYWPLKTQAQPQVDKTIEQQSLGSWKRVRHGVISDKMGLNFGAKLGKRKTYELKEKDYSACKNVCEEQGKFKTSRNTLEVVDLLTYSQCHIDVVISGLGGKCWRFTGFYGYPEQSQRKHSWTSLRRLASMSTLPWVCMGDFNEILCDKEKMGGIRKNWKDMLDFREVLEDCNLEDMGYIGPCFTWSNKR
ncbi:hypothetical protein Dsin_002649 [Dipteronia sinensis]|uniref:CCHC-type domain-containing protein n=1 Tax=Dipteronia sinensis TaxID=43782 RepID=A0AAE0EJG8_9ROSI|nr:hypothetical protein Dsin_002649 [Dipteronia sinensis]